MKITFKVGDPVWGKWPGLDTWVAGRIEQCTGQGGYIQCDHEPTRVFFMYWERLRPRDPSLEGEDKP